MTCCRQIAAVASLGLAVATGCGARDMAPVRGKVAFDGRPITSGALIFSPIPAGEQSEPGKSSTGDIQRDGSFQLSTYKLHDGAIVGRHRVRFMRSVEDEKRSDSSAQGISDYANLTIPKEFVAEVMPGGNNEINVELVKEASP